MASWGSKTHTRSRGGEEVKGKGFKRVTERKEVRGMRVGEIDPEGKK